MIRIKCSNAKCPSATGTFDWDETEEVDNYGGIAQPHETGAVRVIAVCSYCETENVIWVKGIQLKDIVEEEEEE